ncbi:MAG: PriCT-2 domain-containing protein [Alistipes sp.]|nr:PriCT-2 domain-containing protein [Alistipes sp.]
MNVSYFSDIYNSRTPIGSLPLETILFSERVRARVEALRGLPYGSEAFQLAKRQMPCYTPSGVFEVRNSEGLIKHSGVLCIEWDKVEDVDVLKDLLGGLPFVYYAGLSCSGRGVFALVKIADPTKHREYFKALSEYFGGIGYRVDESGKDVCRLRVASFDDTPIFNPDSEMWNELPREVAPTYTPRLATATDERLLLAGVDYITRNSIDITQGRSNWLAIGSCVKSIMGAGGEDVFVALSRYHPKYRENDARKTYHTISGSGYGIGVFASACSRAGVPRLNDLIVKH